MWQQKRFLKPDCRVNWWSGQFSPKSKLVRPYSLFWFNRDIKMIKKKKGIKMINGGSKKFDCWFLVFWLIFIGFDSLCCVFILPMCQFYQTKLVWTHQFLNLVQPTSPIQSLKHCTKWSCLEIIMVENRHKIKTVKGSARTKSSW